MLKTVAVAAVLAACALSAPAHAMMDCDKEFRVRLDRMMTDTKMITGDMVSMTRWVLQGYDACKKGDMEAAKSFFEKASKSSS